MLKDMLRIWSWDEENLTLEKGHEWNTANRTGVLGVYPSDVDGDGDTELITVGFDSNGTVSYAQLRIWCWNGDTLVLEKSQEWCAAKEALVNSVYAIDVDGDGVTEIITSGFDHDLENSSGQLRIWNWNGEMLTLEKSHEWYNVNLTEVKSLSIEDVDGDGKQEILTSGLGTAPIV